MPSNTQVIADAGNTMITLLRNGLSQLSDDPNTMEKSIILSSPNEISAGDEPRLCLYLYQIMESPYLKNLPVETINESSMDCPGITLDLYYMLIPYESQSISNKTERALEMQGILGKSMQIFHDNQIIRDPLLTGTLAGKGLSLRLSLNPVSIDDTVKIWQAISKPYKPSIYYMATPVVINSDKVIQINKVEEVKYKIYAK